MIPGDGASGFCPSRTGSDGIAGMAGGPMTVVKAITAIIAATAPMVTTSGRPPIHRTC